MAEALPADLAKYARPALFALGLVGAGWVLRDLPMRDFMQGVAGVTGLGGMLAFVLLGAAACAAGLPRQVVAFAAGFAHGAWRGAALALAAQLLGCAVDFAWARLVATGWVRARIARAGGRLARLDRALRSHPFGATLSLRLLPVGNNLMLNLLGGALGLPLLPFLAASTLGYLPQTAIFALLGSGTRVAGWIELALGAAGLVVSALLGLWLVRRENRAAQPETTRNAP